MYNIEKEFDLLEKKIKENENSYKNAINFTQENNVPYILLTEEEIMEFNENCQNSGIDLKVVTLDENNQNCLEYYLQFNEEESEEENEQNEQNEQSDVKKEDNLITDNPNNYLGIKRNKSFNKEKDDSDEDEGGDKNEEFKQLERSFSFNDKFEKRKEKPKNKKDKQKKKGKKSRGIKDIFNNPIFKRISEESRYNKEENEIRKKVIKEIQEKSQDLPKGLLQEYLDKQKIRMFWGYELSRNDLEKKKTNQLENILNDINLNSKFYKLNINREPNIRSLKMKEEREKREEENRLKKEIKEKEKIEQNSIININNDQNKESDSEDSESSYDKKDDDELN